MRWENKHQRENQLEVNKKKLSPPKVWKQGGSHFTKGLCDIIFPFPLQEKKT